MENIVVPDRSQMTIWRMRIATVVARTHLSVTFISTLPVLLPLREHQQMHNSTIYILFLLLCCYMFRRNCHLEGAYAKISLKRTEINIFTVHIHVNSAGLG